MHTDWFQAPSMRRGIMTVMGIVLDRLELVEVERPALGVLGVQERARYARWLVAPLKQLDLVVNGVSLLRQVLALDLPSPYGFTGSEFVSVADLAWPQESASSLTQLAGSAERDPAWDVLEPGRLPLYVCPVCADVYCGALTVAVHREIDPNHAREVVSWTHLRSENAYTPAEQTPDLSPLGSFTFDAAGYDATLDGAVKRLNELTLAEDQAKAAWAAQRRLPARLRRLVRR